MKLISGNLIGITRSILAGLLCVSATLPFSAATVDSWSFVHFAPNPRVITYGDGLFVGGGAQGNLATSPDGVVWTTQYSGTTTINNLTYADGQFMAVGNSGGIASSSDGINWVPLTRGSDSLFGVAHGNGRWVAVGLGVAMYSDDGFTWETATTPISTSLFGVTYGGSQFVAVGNGLILTSPDGDVWTSQTPASFKLMYDVVYAEGRFVIAGDSGSLQTSTDGVVWTEVGGALEARYRGVTHGNGTFVAMGERAGLVAPDKGFSYSDDGVNWTHVSNLDYIDVAYGGTRFVALTGTERAYYSDTGTSWTFGKSFSNNDSVSNITYGNGIYVADGVSSGFMRSPDALNWTGFEIPGSPLIADLRFLNGQFTLAAFTLGIALSDNGVDWNFVDPDPSLSVVGIAYGDGFWLALGDYQLGVSANGVNWTIREFNLKDDQNFPVSFNGRRGPFGNNIWVVVDTVSAGKAAYSSNFLTWHYVHPGNSTRAQDITFGNGVFVMVTGLNSNGEILYSTNGSVWTKATLPDSDAFHSCVYNNGLFVVSGSRGKVLSSPNGINWTEHETGTGAQLNQITWGDGRFVAAGLSHLALSGLDVIIENPSPLPGGGFQFSVPATPGQVYEIDCSINLVDWVLFQTYTNLSNNISVEDPNPNEQKYYRVRQLAQ